LIAQQLVGRRKAKEKLPTFFKTRGIIYPPSVNIEQSSSEATAKYKSTLIDTIVDRRGSIADLTGGFGVDSFFFSKLFLTTHCVEPNQQLLEITKHNHAVLQASNIQYHSLTAEEFLKSTDQKFDLIYLDPSRRDENNRKLFRLADTKPNVIELLPMLLARTELVLIKTSPLLDIQQGLSEISCVEKVFVVSVGNECKELLFLLNEKFTQEPLVVAVEWSNAGEAVHHFSFRLSEERAANVTFSQPLTYLYEPSASILKSGAFKLVAATSRIFKLSPNTHLYTSEQFVSDFPGRIFKIERSNPNQKELEAMLPQRKANVTTRNYPLSSAELKKKLKLRDGGDKFVIGFSEQKRKTIVVASRVR
jgi:16S rRNA G966 N2-methylase RsmD